MHILVLALNYSPELVGNAKFTSEMVEWFAKKSKKIIVITTNPFYPKWECENNNYSRSCHQNIDIIRCPIYVPKKLNGITRSLHYLSFFISSFPVVMFYIFKKIDVAFTICPTILSAPSILILSFIKRTFLHQKIISWIHFADLEIEAAFQLKYFRNRYLKKFLFFYEKKILANFTFISSISFFMNDTIKQKLNTYKKIHYLPNFIETNEFIKVIKNMKLNPYFHEISIYSEKKVIMYSGSINEKLSCETLIQTIRILNSRQDLIWIICGDGPKKSYLEKKLSKYKNVKFYDFQPYIKLPYWLNIADIHLIPQKVSSVKFCLPSKLLGILASGKPVLGIAPINSELGKVLDNYGVRLSNEDPKKMAELLTKLLDNKKLRTQLGKNSQNYIKKFHEKDKILKDILLKLENFYHH